LKEENSMNVSITDFGAVADGKTNNHDAIQQALDYAHANGGGVLIPTGNFAYSGTLTDNGVAVTGTGTGSILTAQDGANESLIVTGNGASVSNLQMDGVTSSGRMSTFQSGEIWVSNAQNYTIQNVLINGSSSVGIVSDNSSNGHILNNTVENTLADSIHTTDGSHDITISQNRVLHSGDDGISIVSYQGQPISHDITIDGNSVISNNWGRSLSVVGGNNVQITGNHVEGGAADFAGVYISAENEWGTQGVSNVTVSGNTLIDAGGTSSGHGAITVYNSQGGSEQITGVTLSGNQIVDPLAAGVLVTGAGYEQVDTQNNTVYSDGHALLTNNDGAAAVNSSGDQLLAAAAYSAPLVASGGGVDAAPAPAPAPAPAADPSSDPASTTSDPVLTTSDSGSTTDAHATPVETLGHIDADSTGIAHGTAGNDDIYATGADQTLIGGGGDDIFHVGTHSEAHIVETGSGVSEVQSNADFTLPTGVSNLTGVGSSGITLTGNAASNYITANSGHDVMNGGDGNDVLVAGSGASTMTGGAGHDTFVFNAVADHGNTIADFTSGQDLLDLHSLVKATGYTGTDPFHDNILHLVQSGANTDVVVDPHGNGDAAAHTVVTLDHVLPSAIKPGTDLVWH
jgi:Ca2+-binding RTX toxin-like protein